MPEKDYKNMTALNPTTSLTETAAQTGFVPEIRKDATIGELDGLVAGERLWSAATTMEKKRGFRRTCGSPADLPRVRQVDRERIRSRGDGSDTLDGGQPRRGDTLGRAGIKLES